MTHRPLTWTFDLDSRVAGMSLVHVSPTQAPIKATPDNIDLVVAGYPRTEATPGEVQDLLDVSHQLLRVSVVHYELAVVALEKSLQALELAVRLHLKTGGRPNFVDLVKQLEQEGRITPEEVELIDIGRQLRNSFAHPRGVFSFPLVMAVDLLQVSHRLIASLFPD